MAAVTKYKYYCTTESAWLSTDYRTDPPTTCVNDPTHTIDANSIAATDKVSEYTVVSKDDTSGVTGDYQARGQVLDIPASVGTHYLTFSSPETKIKLISFGIELATSNVGDSLSMVIYPYTPIGLFSQNATTGDTVLNITHIPNPAVPNVFDVLIPGYLCYDGNDQTSLDFITAVDPVNSTVTVKTPIPQDIAAGSLLLFAIPRAWNIYVNKDNFLELGKGSSNTMVLEADAPVGVFYTNNDGVAKKINFIYEYYY